MDFSLSKQNYKILKTIRDASFEDCVQADFSLPEYMPEVLRIIKSVAQPKILSCRQTGDRVNVEGVCDMKMIYTAEDGCIYCFSQSKSFGGFCENPDFTDSVDVRAVADAEYVNCKATGTKTAEMKAGIKVRVTVYKEENEEVASLSEKGSIEEKCVDLEVVSTGCRKTRSFSMSDSVCPPTPSAFILSDSAYAICTEIRKIGNKIMVKGEAIVEISYVNGNDKSCTEQLKHTLPINQILEFDGMEEKFTGDVRLCVSAAEIVQRNDSGGEGNVFEISLSIDATASMWEQKQLSLITDAYAINGNIELKKRNYCFYSPLDSISQDYTLKESFRVTGEGVGNILNSCAKLSGISFRQNENGVLISGSVAVSCIMRDLSGGISVVNKMFDFSLDKKLDCGEMSVVCEPEATLASIECVPVNSTTVEVRGCVKIMAQVFGCMHLDVVTDITESDKQTIRKNNAITVYFPDTEESLWAVARRYNTTVKAIAMENNIEGDTTGNLKMLFIPAN